MNGLSTGALSQIREDWDQVIKACYLYSNYAIELNCNTPERLKSLLSYLNSKNNILDNFEYKSVHLYDSITSDYTELKLVGKIRKYTDYFVFHANAVRDDNIRLLQYLDNQLLIENMDSTKSYGQVPEHLNIILKEVPYAGVVIDLAHCHNIDNTGKLFKEFNYEFNHLISHYNLSVLADNNYSHISPSLNDLNWLYDNLINKDKVKIWEEVPVANFI